MRRIDPTSAFKRDYKRESNGKYKATLESDFANIVQILANQCGFARKCLEIAMSLVLDDPQTVAIARKLAVAEGVTVEQAIRLSLEASAARVRLPPEQSVNEALTELRTWAQSHIQRAPGDTASVDEILGYDEHGAW